MPTLPNAVSTFFDIINGGDIPGLVDCFSEDAVVRDERRSHHGHAAIIAWQEEVRAAVNFTATVVDIVGDEVQVNALCHVEGNFRGSPVKLEHRFTMAGEKIQTLEIV